MKGNGKYSKLFMLLCVGFCSYIELNDCVELRLNKGGTAPVDCKVTGDPTDISLPDMFERLPEYNKKPYGNKFITLNFDTRSNEMAVCKGTGNGGGDGENGGGDGENGGGDGENGGGDGENGGGDGENGGGDGENGGGDGENGGGDGENGGGDGENGGGGQIPSCGNTSGFCTNFYDIVFSVEESSFTGRDNWIKVMRPFVQKTVKAFKISKDEVHMSVVLFSSDTRPIVTFEDAASQNKKLLIEEVGKIEDVCQYHGVLYGDTLLYVLDDVLYGPGSRADASKVSVLFTYGSDNNTNKPLIPRIIKRYKEACVKLIVYSTMITEDILELVGCKGDVSACPSIITVQWEYIMSAVPRIKEKVCEDKDKDEFDDDDSK